MGNRIAAVGKRSSVFDAAGSCRALLLTLVVDACHPKVTNLCTMMGLFFPECQMITAIHK